MAHTDTPSHVAQMQIALLRRAGPARRLAVGISLSEMVISLSRAGFSRTHPGVSGRDADCLFVEHHYGSRLAAQVREHLRQRGRDGQT